MNNFHTKISSGEFFPNYGNTFAVHLKNLVQVVLSVQESPLTDVSSAGVAKYKSIILDL